MIIIVFWRGNDRVRLIGDQDRVGEIAAKAGAGARLVVASQLDEVVVVDLAFFVRIFLLLNSQIDVESNG